jgi:nucleotide-binding universal stress UspA family protein
MFNRILIPLDGSPQGEHVIDLATRVATPGQSTLRVVCVVDAGYTLSEGDLTGIEPDGIEYPPAAREQYVAERIVTAAVEHLYAAGLHAEGHALSGEATSIILGEAVRIGADLIVMGHRHLSRLRRWADPSTATEVIEHAPCPVLVQTLDSTVDV